jgi:hypothetical protein
VVKLAAVVVAHARTRPDHHHEVNLLMNGLVSAQWIGVCAVPVQSMATDLNSLWLMG